MLLFKVEFVVFFPVFLGVDCLCLLFVDPFIDSSVFWCLGLMLSLGCMLSVLLVGVVFLLVLSLYFFWFLLL